MRALVLCAGLGTRLAGLTRARPKPMLELGGQPLLSWTLRWLVGHGFTDVAINLHFLPDMIRNHFGDGRDWGVRIHWSHEEALLGTAGSTRQLAPWLLEQDDACLVVYGDLLLDQDLRPLLAAHADRGADATLLLHRRPSSNSAIARDPDGRIRAFLERPSDAARGAVADPWVNSGVQILGRDIVARIPESGPADRPRDVYTRSLDLRIFGVPFSGYRCAIDSPARYSEAVAALREGRYHPAPSPPGSTHEPV